MGEADLPAYSAWHKKGSEDKKRERESDLCLSFSVVYITDFLDF